VSHQQVTYLTFLYISAAFYNTDHSVLLARLSSWFYISPTYHSLLDQILFTKPSFLCQYFKLQIICIATSLWSSQGSVLGPLLFIYTPLRSVLSYLSHLENTIANVSNWMSSNFFSLNPSKTEFLIFSLPQQLSKLNNPTIHQSNNVIPSSVDSARYLGVIFAKNSQHISAVSKSCFHNICDPRRTRNTINQTTACTIATAFMHTKIDYFNSLLLNLPTTSTCP